MRKVLSILLSVSMLLTVLPLGVVADDLALDEGHFKYMVSNGEATITEYIGDGGEVIIPVELGGYPVTAIGMDALSNSHIMTLTIPDSLTINPWDVIGCNNLENIYVSVNHPKQSDVDGVVFNKDGSQLMVYPKGRKGAYTIPDGVTSLADQAFKDAVFLTSVSIPDSVTDLGWVTFESCKMLTEVVIPEGVTTLYNYVFCHCTSLVSVTIPKTVTEIGWVAFYGCTSLADVYYGGTEEDKANIYVDTENEPLLNATWHYNYVSPVLYGDVDCDGALTVKDVALLQQYLTGWNVEVVLDYCDIHADEEVNNKDLVVLIRTINGW